MADPSIVLPAPRLLAPIEYEMWTEAGVMPPDVSAVVRGAPINPDKFLAHALRQARGVQPPKRQHGFAERRSGPPQVAARAHPGPAAGYRSFWKP